MLNMAILGSHSVNNIVNFALLERIGLLKKSFEIFSKRRVVGTKHGTNIVNNPGKGESKSEI